MGGKSSSSSSSSSSTQNVDRRVVADNQATAISSDASTINITATDSGAVNAAIDLAKTGTDAASQNYLALLGLTEGILVETSKVIDKNASAAADAYTKAQSSVTGATDDRKLLMIGALLVGGVVAVKAFGKHA